MKSTEEAINLLKTVRGIEWSKGKKHRNDKLIQNTHDHINKLKKLIHEITN